MKKYRNWYKIAQVENRFLRNLLICAENNESQLLERLALGFPYLFSYKEIAYKSSAPEIELYAQRSLFYPREDGLPFPDGGILEKFVWDAMLVGGGVWSLPVAEFHFMDPIPEEIISEIKKCIYGEDMVISYKNRQYKIVNNLQTVDSFDRTHQLRDFGEHMLEVGEPYDIEKVCLVPLEFLDYEGGYDTRNYADDVSIEEVAAEDVPYSFLYKRNWDYILSFNNPLLTSLFIRSGPTELNSAIDAQRDVEVEKGLYKAFPEAGIPKKDPAVFPICIVEQAAHHVALAHLQENPIIVAKNDLGLAGKVLEAFGDLIFGYFGRIPRKIKDSLKKLTNSKFIDPTLHPIVEIEYDGQLEEVVIINMETEEDVEIGKPITIEEIINISLVPKKNIKM